MKFPKTENRPKETIFSAFYKLGSRLERMRRFSGDRYISEYADLVGLDSLKQLHVKIGGASYQKLRSFFFHRIIVIASS